MVALNAERDRPDALIDLGRVEELRGWHREGDELVLGAGVTYTQAAGGELASELPALAAASRTVGSPQIRNRGTLGGNLGTASPAGDALPPLLVEDARIELASSRGRRTLPLAEFLVGPKRNALADDELVVAIRIRPSRRPADVHEGRAAQRDGHLDLLARPERRSRARRAARGVRLGRTGRAARDRSARRGRELLRARRWTRPRRSTTSAARPPIAATRSAC